jgi:hypothetical protein
MSTLSNILRGLLYFRRFKIYEIDGMSLDTAKYTNNISDKMFNIWLFRINIYIRY